MSKLFVLFLYTIYIRCKWFDRITSYGYLSVACTIGVTPILCVGRQDADYELYVLLVFISVCCYDRNDSIYSLFTNVMNFFCICVES